MDDVREKLGRCFAVTFPKLDPSRYSAADVQNVPEWDSIAQLTLLTVIGEEFNMEINVEDFEGATSFEALAQKLQVR